VIFFFHPLVRYASRQFCLEREMACDDRVIGHGADAAMYAESLVKAAERSVRGKLEDVASHSLHQPAFFTSKQALERRIEMVLNTDRVRVLARGWRYLILPSVLIVMVAGLLVPGSSTNAQQSQKQLDDRAASLQKELDEARAQMKDGVLKELLGKYMTDTAAYDNLVNLIFTTVSESDPQLREQALRQIGSMERFLRDPTDEAFYVGLDQAVRQAESLMRNIRESDRTIRMATNNESADTLRKAQEWLAMRQRQASGKGRKGQDDPPPPPPPKPTPSPQSLNDVAAAAEVLQGDQSDTNIVKALIRESIDAYFRRDIAFIERTMADDFQGIGISGEVQSKGEVIAEIKHPRMKITKFEIDDLRLKGEGNSMIATYIGTAYYEEDGQEKIVRLRYTDNLVKRQGSWQWIGSHVSLMR
jgi:ketosteroid isomerase-like protein